MTDAPAPLHGVIPHLTIRDNRAVDAIDFYAKAFGATEVMRMPEQGGDRLMHANLLIAGGTVLLNDDFPEMAGGVAAPAPAGVTLHIDVADADAAWEQALAAGATVRFPIANQFWGQRYGQVTDPFGHHWSIGGPVTE